MKLPDSDQFIHSVSPSLLELRNSLSELNKEGLNPENVNRIQKTIVEYVKSMTLDDHDKIEDVAIELEMMSEMMNIRLAFVHAYFIKALEDEIEAARKKSGERTEIKMSKLKDARESVADAIDNFDPHNIESSEEVTLAIQEALMATRTRLNQFFGGTEMNFRLQSLTLKANRQGSGFLEIIFALNNILKEYKEAEFN